MLQILKISNHKLVNPSTASKSNGSSSSINYDGAFPSESTTIIATRQFAVAWALPSRGNHRLCWVRCLPRMQWLSSKVRVEKEIGTRHHPSAIKLQLIFGFFSWTLVHTGDGNRRPTEIHHFFCALQDHKSWSIGRKRNRRDFIIFEIFIYDHFKPITALRAWSGFDLRSDSGRSPGDPGIWFRWLLSGGYAKIWCEIWEWSERESFDFLAWFIDSHGNRCAWNLRGFNLCNFVAGLGENWF